MKLHSEGWGRLVLALALAAFPWTVQGADFEVPPIMEAKTFLTADLLKGPHYEVEPQAVNDGYMNHYTIRSDFGTFEARSTAMARTRIREVAGIAQLRDLSQTEAFAGALADSAKNTAAAAARVVTDPVGTAKGIPEGVNKMFKRMASTADKVVDNVGEAVTKDEKEGSGGEGGGISNKALEAGKDLAGVNKAKRGLAKRVGVDPYTTNPVLQAELERLAAAAFGGGLATDLAKAGIPVAGQLTKVSGLVWDSSPADLEVMGRDVLAKAGAAQAQIDAFYKAPHLTVTSKFALVAILEKMEGVGGRPEVLRLASKLGSEEEARFFVASCAMLSAYHETKGRLKRILAGAVLPWGESQDGTLVLALALDHLCWTEDVAKAAGRIAGEVKGIPSLKKVELWAAGSLSSRSRQELEAFGWVTRENASPDLGIAQ